MGRQPVRASTQDGGNIIVTFAVQGAGIRSIPWVPSLGVGTDEYVGDRPMPTSVSPLTAVNTSLRILLLEREDDALAELRWSHSTLFQGSDSSRRTL